MMCSETHETPLWVLEPVNIDGTKVGLYVVQIPAIPILGMIDYSGQFNNAVAYQVAGMISGSHLGSVLPNFAVRTDLIQREPAEDELSMILFIKEYRRSTAIVTFNLNNIEVSPELSKKLEDTIKCNSIFRDKMKLTTTRYNMSLLIKDDILTFGLFGKEDDVEVPENIQRSVL